MVFLFFSAALGFLLFVTIKMFNLNPKHTKILVNIYKEGLYTNNPEFRRHYREQFAKRLLEFTQIANMTEENCENQGNHEYDDDETWDDGLTESEIQNVIGFLRCLQQEYDDGEHIEGESEDEYDETSTASMTTVGETIVSNETTNETEDETDESYTEDDPIIVFFETN